MTLQKAIDIFLFLQDKYGSPNVITSEVIEAINMAINEYLNRMFPDTLGGLANFEQDENIKFNIKPLVYGLSGLTIDSTGLITDSVINTALQSATSDVNAKYFRLARVGVNYNGTLYVARFLKDNNYFAYNSNFFKKPSLTNYFHGIEAGGIRIYPTNPAATGNFVVIKNPKVLTTSDLSNQMEFSDYSTYSIIAIALKLAGLATRDQDMLEVDARLADVQILR